MNDTKVCSKCGVEKPLIEFHKGNSKSGRKSHCKVCRSNYRKLKYATDLEYRQKKISKDREYFRNNIDRLRILSHKRYMERRVCCPREVKPKNSATCEIIKKHHEEMKDDPERLTTEFIQKIVKVDCDE